MKACVLMAPDELIYRDVPDPMAGPGDMILRVRAATICGTDIRIFRGRKTAGVRYPSVIGHEFAGEVVEPGDRSRFRRGDLVCVCPAICCGVCEYCVRGYENICRNLIAIGYELDGAFAEYIRIPAVAVQSGNVIPLPAGLTCEHAALAEPLACAINGQDMIEIGCQDVVVILGAGPIGILHVKLAKLAGAKMVIVSQPSALRQEAARKAGADVVLDPTSSDIEASVKSLTNGLGADKVIVAIGAPALVSQAISLVRCRGRVNLFAGFSRNETANIDINAIHYNEILLTGSFGLSRAHYGRALDLLASRRIEVESMITHQFALEEVKEAILVAERREAIKVSIVSSAVG